MKRNYVFPALFLLLLSACHEDDIVGSGLILTENRTFIGNFSKIEVKGAIDVKIKQGDSLKIVVKDYENLLPQLETQVVNNTLIIKYSDAVFNYTNTWVNHSNSEVTLTVPRLNNLKASGSSHISTIGNYNFEELGININDAGDVFLEGTAKKMYIKVSDLGDIRAFGLPTDTVNISISDRGTGQVNVKNKLDVSVSDIGNLVYKGDPSVSSRITDLGKVRKF